MNAIALSGVGVVKQDLALVVVLDALGVACRRREDSRTIKEMEKSK
jgi:hypothetical protein